MPVIKPRMLRDDQNRRTKLLLRTSETNTASVQGWHVNGRGRHSNHPEQAKKHPKIAENQREITGNHPKQTSKRPGMTGNYPEQAYEAREKYGKHLGHSRQISGITRTAQRAFRPRPKRLRPRPKRLHPRPKSQHPHPKSQRPRSESQRPRSRRQWRIKKRSSFMSSPLGVEGLSTPLERASVRRISLIIRITFTPE